MIGQIDLLKQVDTLIENNKLPRFMIIAGPDGSGKKLLAQYICTESNFFWCYMEDNKIETVRKVIEESYKVSSPTCYVFTDTDTMSVAAKNAMLKLTEEPPKNAYIIMTVCNPNMLLNTLTSRATTFNMLPYKGAELVKYAYDLQDDVDEQQIKDLCETPDDVNLLYNIDNKDIVEFVAKVVDNIAEVSLANALKIAQQVGFKKESGKYDVKLFLKVFKMECGRRFAQAVQEGDVDNRRKYKAGIKITTYFLNQIGIIGINKGALFDIFILDIRREWC